MQWRENFGPNIVTPETFAHLCRPIVRLGNLALLLGSDRSRSYCLALPTLRHIERFARAPREITGQSRG